MEGLCQSNFQLGTVSVNSIIYPKQVSLQRQRQVLGIKNILGAYKDRVSDDNIFSQSDCLCQ